MLQKTGNKTYKSPLHKLARFFEKSRDSWKEKYGKVKTENKYLQNRIRYLEKSKAQLSQEALELREKVNRLQAERNKKKQLRKK